MKNEEQIKLEIRESIDVKSLILNDSELINKISIATERIINAYKKNNKTILAGNGGSAADAQHIAAEFVSRYKFDRPGIPSIALTTDTSMLTAIGNDYGFQKLFSRQVEAQGCEGDIFIAISTSGNSPNIIEAINSCKKKGILTIGLTGGNKNLMSSNCDICIQIPSTDTPRIQESHILIGHIICGLVEEELFGHLK